MSRVLVVALLALAACGKKKGDGPREGGTHAVARGRLPITLTEKGTLKTKNSTQLRAETYAKIEWIIEEGKSVKKDEVLVKLDKQDTEKQKEQLENQVTQLEAELKSATTNELIQQQQNQTNIEKAELAVEVARVELKKFNEADDPAERRKLALDGARARVERVYAARAERLTRAVQWPHVVAEVPRDLLVNRAREALEQRA